MPAPRYVLHIRVPSEDMYRLSYAIAKLTQTMGDMPMTVWIEQPEQHDDDEPVRVVPEDP